MSNYLKLWLVFPGCRLLRNEIIRVGLHFEQNWQ
jgi:hypothetical protein